MSHFAPACRYHDWPERLSAVVATAQDQPYILGTWDCLRFSCACIEAMTGADFWPRFAGYHTRREAVHTILSIAPTLAEAVSIVLDVEPQPAVLAARGDLMIYHDTEDHLGVCTGRTVAVLGPDGLVHVPLTDAGLRGAWRVG